MMEGAEGSPLRISCTVRALSSALRGDLEADAGSQRSPLGRSSSAGPGGLWFKESSAKNLRSRDFLAPAAVLKKLYPDGQVPGPVVQRLLSLQAPGLLPLGACEASAAGLRVRADRPAVFRDVLEHPSLYLGPPPGQLGRGVVLNCPVLHPRPSSGSLSLGQLRAVLVTDHLAALFRKQGFSVSLCPVLEEGSDIISFLRLLGVDWPTVSTGWTNQETEQALWEALLKSPYAEEAGAGDLEAAGGASSEKVGRRIRVDIRRVIQEQRLQGYDPSLTTCLVLQDSVAHLAQLEGALSRCQAAACTVLHIAGSPGEFRQQQVAVLWQALGLRAPGGPGVRQRLLLCGPVQTSGSDSELSACQYLQLRRAQMREASEMKYGEVQGQAWDDIIRVMTSATVKFDLLSSAHHSPVTLDVRREACVSTKGGRGGVFVLYNCARLATLFANYQQAVQQGLYPQMPEASQLDFTCLKEEGEWLLLFNYIIPFLELLEQSGQALGELGREAGPRISLGTEAVCKFLVSLSMDFSSYYNRVHILGEPRPHLFAQMLSRLRLLGAVQRLFHCALEMLHVPPLRQL